LREVLRVTDGLPREQAKAVRGELREAAKPVAAEAQRTMVAFLTTHGTLARKSRFGVTVRRTGTVTVEQRVRSKGTGRKQPKFVDRQLDDALLPAAANGMAGLEKAGTDVLERLQRKWVTG